MSQDADERASARFFSIAPRESHLDRECRLLGHEFAHEPDAEEGDPATCIHCGAEQ